MIKELPLSTLKENQLSLKSQQTQNYSKEYNTK